MSERRVAKVDIYTKIEADQSKSYVTITYNDGLKENIDWNCTGAFTYNPYELIGMSSDEVTAFFELNRAMEGVKNGCCSPTTVFDIMDRVIERQLTKIHLNNSISSCCCSANHIPAS